jgi:hypothetical protein
MRTGTNKFLTKLGAVLLLSITSLSGLAPKLFAQGASISGQSIQPLPPTGSGGPAANAPILVCSAGATGTPCSPTVTVYSDPGLTQVVSSPATDANGNYSYFVSPQYVIIQITVLPGVVYSYSKYAGIGSVSSVSLLMPNIFTINGGAGCTITTSGTCNVTLVSQPGNLIFASPNGLAGYPTFRGILGADFGTQSAYNILANCTSSSALPTFCLLNANMIPSTLNATNFSGNVGVTGSVSVSTNLSVSGTITTPTLDVTTSATIASVSGNLGITGNLSAVEGTFSSTLASGSLTATGTITSTEGLISGGSSATLSGSGVCATLTSETAGSFAGNVTCNAATSGASELNIFSAFSAPHGWTCFGSDVNSGLAGGAIGAPSTGGCTLRFSSVAQGDVISFAMIAY